MKNASQVIGSPAPVRADERPVAQHRTALEESPRVSLNSSPTDEPHARDAVVEQMISSIARFNAREEAKSWPNERRSIDFKVWQPTPILFGLVTVTLPHQVGAEAALEAAQAGAKVGAYLCTHVPFTSGLEGNGHERRVAKSFTGFSSGADVQRWMADVALPYIEARAASGT